MIPDKVWALVFCVLAIYAASVYYLKGDGVVLLVAIFDLVMAVVWNARTKR